MGYAYLNKSTFEFVWPTSGYHKLESYTMFVGAPFQISGTISGIQDFFMRLGLAVLQLNLTSDYRKMFALHGFVLYV